MSFAGGFRRSIAEVYTRPYRKLSEHPVEVDLRTSSLASVEQLRLEAGLQPASSSVVKKHSIEVDSGTAASDAVRVICRPIQCWAIEREQANLSGSASSVDRVNFLEVRHFSKERLCAHYKLWLYIEGSPCEINKGRTILISTVDNASALEHRLISTCSPVTRLFQKILALILEKEVVLSPYENGFNKVDGVSANIFILRNLADHATKSRELLEPCCFICKKSSFLWPITQ